MRRGLLIAALLAALVVTAPRSARAYSVLAHEAAIDAAWDASIRPLLLRRYPRTSAAGLRDARAFAYGGSVIQDLGYYPFGNRFFSNLLHYTRSGDFVEALVRDALDVNELAFALGALAHYANDNVGHPEAVNRVVPLTYPKLQRKYGKSVTYVEGRKQHVIVEFSFDVVQAAGGAYLPEAYRQFIGFRVATDLLDRAFRDTYGLALDDVFGDPERMISTYRYSVSQLVPALTTAAWKDKHDEIAKLTPNLPQSDFVFVYRRADYEQDYGRNYQRPGWFARFVGVLYRIVPKVGPLAPLSFKAPTADAEAIFAASFREAAARYRRELAEIAAGHPDFRNTNFDTGTTAPRWGDYRLADETYEELLKRWQQRHFDGMPAALRRDVLAFFAPENAADRRQPSRPARWMNQALSQLRENRTSTRAAKSASSP